MDPDIMKGPGNTAVIIGDPDSIFPRTLAEVWRRKGLDVAVVTHHWKKGEQLPDGTPVFSSAMHESRWLRRWLRLLRRSLSLAEGLNLCLERKRFEGVLGPEAERSNTPSFVNPIVRGISMARLVRRLQPRFIFGQQAYTYGPATARCREFPTIMMPWGGDIYRYAESTSLSFRMTRRALGQIDLICPTALTAADHLVDRFKVSREKVCALSWGVDLEKFRPASGVDRNEFRLKYQIPADAMVCVNSRRFKPEWGCFEVLDAFIEAARVFPEGRFVMIGGPGAEDYIDRARLRLKETGVEDRFILFRGEVPLEQYIEMLQIADVYLSLMLKRDMRSASILQGAATGACPILNDDPEYREMEKLGFRALYVDPKDPGQIVEAMKQYLTDEGLRDNVIQMNREYVSEHEDFDGQMDKLLEKIEGVCRQKQNSSANSRCPPKKYRSY